MHAHRVALKCRVTKQGDREIRSAILAEVLLAIVETYSGVFAGHILKCRARCGCSCNVVATAGQHGVPQESGPGIDIAATTEQLVRT